MPSCVVCARSRTRKTRNFITFHKFPVDLEKKELWIKFVGKDNWTPRKYSCICSQHFEESCFDTSSPDKIQLRKEAIPTINIKRLRYDRSEITTPRITPDEPEELQSVQPDTSNSPTKLPLKRKNVDLEYATFSHAKKKIILFQKHCSDDEKRIFRLKRVIEELQTKQFIIEEHASTLMNRFGKNEELINRACMFSKTQTIRLSRKFGVEIINFANTLHFFSSNAYQYVREHFQTCFPVEKTLVNLSSVLDGGPGFTKQILELLKVKAWQQEKKLICSLVLDEMDIHQHTEWDGNRLHGYVDFGSNLHSEDVDVAREVLVFMLVPINATWKMPIGYFFINRLSSAQKASLVLRCIDAVRSCNVQISNLTFEGSHINFTMANILGCDLNALCSYFEYNESRIYVYPDPSCMIKLVWNTFRDRKILTISKDESNVINFNYVIKLNKLEEGESLQQKIKTQLTSQLLSNSVTEALLYCKNCLKLESFQNCTETVKFIEMINNAFNILNSHSIKRSGFKKALNKQNFASIIRFSKEFTKFVSNLKFEDNTLLIDSNRRIGFQGLLICFKSIIGMYRDHVEGGNVLGYIPFYKCSQDHTKLFFASVKVCVGSNNYLTTRQFTAAYKKLIVYSETGDGCVPLHQINILNNITSPLPPECEINESVQLLPSVFEQIVPEEHNERSYFFTADALSTYDHYVVTYIGGFVVCSVAKKIKCEKCFAVLYGNKPNLMYNFTNFKDKGTLIHPSDDVINLCSIAEKLFRKNVLPTTNITKLISTILIEACKKNIFTNLENHMYDTNPVQNHLLLLIKCIVINYVNIRMHYASENLKPEEKVKKFLYQIFIK